MKGVSYSTLYKAALYSYLVLELWL